MNTTKTPKFHAKVQEILDKLEPHERVCALTGEKWMMDEEEIKWLKKFHVPPATWCPMARMKIVAAYATGFGWWWNKHAKTGEKVLSYVHPATGLKVLPDPEFYEQNHPEQESPLESFLPKTHPFHQ